MFGLFPDRGRDDLRMALVGAASSSSSSEICRRHSSAMPMLKKYMLQHLRERLAEREEIFCVPLRPGILRRLQNVLRPSLPGEHTTAEELQLPSFQIDLDQMSLEDMHAGTDFGKALQQVLFCHVVRTGPSKLVRVSAAGEIGFQASDVVIAPHRVLHVDGSQREVVLEASSLDWVTQGGKEPLILSLESFSCEDLLCMFKWQTDEMLAHGLWGCEMPPGFASQYQSVLPKLLEALLAEHGHHGYVLDARREGAAEWKSCLDAMQGAGHVRMTGDDSRFSRWLLLKEGQQAIKVGYRVRRPEIALRVRQDVEAASLTVWELIATLDQQGWTHLILEKSSTHEPYVPGSGPLVWYTKPGDDTVSSWYLLALLQGTVEVPHWKAAAFYQALVEGRAVAKRARCSRQALAIKNVDPDEWDLPAPLPAEPMTRKQGRKRKLPPPALNDNEALDNDALAGQPEDEELTRLINEELEAELAKLDSASCSASSAPGAREEADEESSSSSSSSSSTSSSKGGPAPSAGRKARAKNLARAKAAQARAANPKASIRYGMGHCVRVYKKGEAIGWEMSCGHPGHRDLKCRKNLKEVTRGRTAQDTLQLLKIWLIRGRHALSGKEHLTEIWSEVERDFKLGQLEQAPEEPPLNYTDLDGQTKWYNPRES